jgi:hypothetical protein
MTVLTGICIRVEGAIEGLTLEVRGLRTKLDLMDRRVRVMEDKK